MMNPSVSLIIPVYNEAEWVRPTVERCLTVLSQDFSDFEIILVDDGSRDNTGEIMDVLSTEHPHVRVLHNLVNLNVGVSIQRAFVESSKEYVVHSAIDLPLAVEDVAKVLSHVKDTDVLVLERDGFPNYTLWRKICSYLNRGLLSLLFHSGIHDLNFAQVYRRQVVTQILPLAKSPSFTTPEMILRAKHKRLRIKAIPWPYRPRTQGRGAFGKPHDILWSLYDMLRFRLLTWIHAV